MTKVVWGEGGGWEFKGCRWGFRVAVIRSALISRSSECEEGGCGKEMEACGFGVGVLGELLGKHVRSGVKVVSDAGNE